MGVEIEIVQEKERLRPKNSEVERLWAANSKAKELTGWVPEYGGLTGFKRGIMETIAWFTRPENLKCYKIGVYNI